MYFLVPKSYFKSGNCEVYWRSRENNIENRTSWDFPSPISSLVVNELSTWIALVSDYQPNLFIVCEPLTVMCSRGIWRVVVIFCSSAGIQFVSHFPISIGLNDENEDDTTGDGSSDDSSDSSSSDTWS